MDSFWRMPPPLGPGLFYPQTWQILLGERIEFFCGVWIYFLCISHLHSEVIA